LKLKYTHCTGGMPLLVVGNNAHPTVVQGIGRGKHPSPHPVPRVVTWMIEDGRMDDRTMAVGSSVTWTHCSDRYKVTSRINRRVSADAGVHPGGHTHSLPPSPPLPSPPLPSPPSIPTCLVRTQSAVHADGLRPLPRGRSK
jgi:hypothetical protein